MKRSLKDFLQDVLDSITEIELFTQDITFEEFQTKREKILAVVKLLEIIGEAVKQLPDDLRLQYSHIPWKSIAGI